MGAMKNKKSNNEDLKKKERHIVTWSQQEDDILREQISIHGTDNWTIIASKFKDKTTRQCRRRWYTYLNSDFKKGGWSPEEDMLLCEAQKVFGNRWTEIAKVVSGRTDNAVKNRFSTLCKKRAKYEAMVKENSSSYINLNNKRVLSDNILEADEISPFELRYKKIRRTSITDPTCSGYSLHKQSGIGLDQQLRTPLAVLVQNINSLTGEQRVSNVDEIFDNTHNNKIQGAFLKKDDPKMAALMQQADLLSSLAEKVSTEKTDQSFENAWKVLQEFLNREKGGGYSGNMSGINFQQEGYRERENFIGPNEDSQTSWRHLELCEESSASSEYSIGSAILLHTSNDRTEEAQTGRGAAYEYNEYMVQSLHTKSLTGTVEYDNGMISAITAEPEILQTGNGDTNGGGVDPALSKAEFGSPIQLTPIFTSLAAGIPSPKFSESERSFLMKTLGMESPASNHITTPSHPPPCKRALLQSF